MRFPPYLVLFLGTLLGLFTVFPTVLRADGMAYGLSSLRPIEQNEQRAAILHRDGVETMIIAINIRPDESESALWLFPVPGTPGQVKFDFVEAFPVFLGEDPRREAAHLVASVMLLPALTQGWAIVPAVFAHPIWRVKVGRGVSVHEQTEKWGLQAEMITTPSVEALRTYLQEKHGDISEQQLQPFAPYLSGHVLIAVRVTSRESLLKEFPEYGTQYSSADRWPSLLVRFPTERPFYPLRPTSGYGQTVIPVRLFVVGHVKPDMPSSWAGFTKVSYQMQSGSVKQTAKQFTQGLPANFAYTRIELEAPAESFTADLWFDRAESKSLAYAMFVNTLGGWTALLIVLALTAVLSYAAAGLSAWWLLGKWKGYAELGLMNLLTVLGLLAGVKLLPGSSARALREKKLTASFIRLFSLIFFCLWLLLEIGLLLPLRGNSEAQGAVTVGAILLLLFGLFTWAVGSWMKKKVWTRPA